MSSGSPTRVRKSPCSIAELRSIADDPDAFFGGIRHDKAGAKWIMKLRKYMRPTEEERGVRKGHDVVIVAAVIAKAFSPQPALLQAIQW
jgi:hypothetical protein